MKPERYKLSDAARKLDIGYWTLHRQAKAGKVPVIRSETGRLYVPVWWIDEQVGNAPKSTDIRCAIYARESSTENKAALQSQLDGLRQYAQAKGYQIVHVVQEFGSGVNDERPKLHGLLVKRDFDILLVEHKDRLTRFGFRWFETLCPFRIEVINIAENKSNDLMEDLVAILTSFSARLYGQRRGRNKTKAAIKALESAE